MPELPEVETIRRDLEKEVVGKRIKSVEVKTARAVRRHANRKQFVTRLEGAKLDSLRRRGKYLIFELDTDDLLVVHLGMSGQLLKTSSKDPVAKHTHAIMTFTVGAQLRYVDPRTFGEMFITPKETFDTDVPEIAGLGFDPVEDVISWTDFGAKLTARKTKLKPLLMDQKFMAGIGNIYSDEILWHAGLRQDRTSDSLSSQEVRRLYRALVETIHEAIKHRGSSLADQQYRDLQGEVGGYQSEHQVYDREGKPCARCRAPIVRVKVSGRSSFFCASCQV